MHMLRMALRSLRREWRSGELAVLWVALAVAIAALTGVGFLVDRIGRSVQSQASEVLAADARVESPELFAPAKLQQAQRLGLQTSRLTILLSVVFNGDQSQLADVRAVSAGYPLRGVLHVAAQPFAAGVITRELPAVGECWPDSRLAAALGVRVGAALNVGARSLRVSRILIARPDQGAAFVEFASSLLINDADLASTQLVQPASRMHYALLLAGDAPALKSYGVWFDSHKRPGERLAQVSDASPQIGDAVRRASRFLALASLVAVLLCAVAVAMSARGYVQRQFDAVALMKTLGAERRFVLGVTLLQMLALAIAATSVGSVAGWLTQRWLLQALAGLLRTDLPPAGFAPIVMGFVVGIVLLVGFALPTLLQLTRVPALRVLRRDVGPPAPRLWWSLTPAALAIAGLIYGVLGEWRLSMWFAVALAVVVAVLGLGGIALVTVAARARASTRLALRHGLANLSRRRSGAVAQIVAFGLGVMLLLMLTILRRDLIADWRTSVRTDAPNYFFVNIPPEQRADFGAALKSAGAQLERILPIVRARLTSVNGIDIHGRNGRDQPQGETRGGEMAEREQNLTWSSELGDDNRITAGHWWSTADEGKPWVSLASEFQEALGLKLGDRLSFDVAGEGLEVIVTSFRKVKWDSFRPNFFIVLPPGLLDGAAGSYMTSARYEPHDAGALSHLVQRFPSVSIFNIGDILAQIRAVIDKAVTAVQSVFVFTLFAGLAVLLAAVQASRTERRYEMGILRVLGAERSLLLRSTLAEFVALGVVAGLLAATCAALAGFLVARQLDLHYRFDVLIWGGGVLLTTAIVGLSGVLATRSVLSAQYRW